MSVDVVDLREFYATPLGRLAVSSIVAAVDRAGDLKKVESLLGFGYPLPLFDSAVGNFDQAMVLMPARQGAIRWPKSGPVRTLLSEDDELPFATGSLQCVVVMHVLENTSEPALVLDEIWRVLMPEGKLFLLATNRRGLWARFEHTPFGNGRPYSKGQLSGLLRKAKLSPMQWETCLDFPPIGNKWLLATYPVFEKVARRAWPIFCGAHLVVANKRLYQGVPHKALRAKRVRMPVLAPQNAGAGRHYIHDER